MVMVTIQICTLKEPATCKNKQFIGVDGEELNPEGRKDKQYPNEINGLDVCTACNSDCQYARAADMRIPDAIAFPTNE